MNTSARRLGREDFLLINARLQRVAEMNAEQRQRFLESLNLVDLFLNKSLVIFRGRLSDPPCWVKEAEVVGSELLFTLVINTREEKKYWISPAAIESFEQQGDPHAILMNLTEGKAIWQFMW